MRIEHSGNDVSDAAHRLAHYNQDRDFLEGRRKELTEKYPDWWVAVYSLRVVGVNKSFARLLRSLQKNGVPTGQTVIDCMYTKPVDFSFIGG